jgi:hypothetical protein
VIVDVGDRLRAAAIDLEQVLREVEAIARRGRQARVHGLSP